jgi:thymidine phosphorylase
MDNVLAGWYTNSEIQAKPSTISLFGRGAFQAAVDDAIELAASMVATGEANGLVLLATAFLIRMDHPIWYAVGNWSEVKECIDITMRAGQGSRDLLELVLMQAGQMLLQSGVFPDCSFQVYVHKAHNALEDGKAEMVLARGGDISVVVNAKAYPMAKHSCQVLAQRNDFIAHVDALAVVGAARSWSFSNVSEQSRNQKSSARQPSRSHELSRYQCSTPPNRVLL